MAEIETSGGRATGVRLRDGQRLHARRAVVSNASLWDTLALLPAHERPQEMLKNAEEIPLNRSFMRTPSCLNLESKGLACLQCICTQQCLAVGHAGPAAGSRAAAGGADERGRDPAQPQLHACAALFDIAGNASVVGPADTASNAPLYDTLALLPAHERLQEVLKTAEEISLNRSFMRALPTCDPQRRARWC